MIDPAVVARESAAWTWWPDDAEVLESEDFVLVRWPPYFGRPPSLERFAPVGDLAETFERALSVVRSWRADELTVWVRLDSPAGLERLVQGALARAEETVEVLATDLGSGAGAIDAPEVHLEGRDPATSRDFARVGIRAFGDGAMPDAATLHRLGEEAHRDRVAGRGCQLIAYVDGRPVGAAGLTMAGRTARLWGAGVVPEERGRGIYRALLRARLRYAADCGADLALVKGRVQTSGPILRRCGFSSFGQERSYRLPL